MERRYWDSCTFLAWLAKEQDRYEKCIGVVKKAEKGEIVIVTSALTIAEVLHIKGKPKLSKSREKAVASFFENDAISIRILDRETAELARDLVWQHNVEPKDAVHLATAFQLRITKFDTFDEPLMKLSGKIGDPLIKIGIPNISHQEDMFEKGQKDKAAEK